MSNMAVQQPVTTADIEDALVLLAYFMELDGDIHLPMYEKLEAELAARMEKENTKDRARRRLDAYVKERGGMKAIC